MKYQLSISYTLLKKQTPEKENDVLDKRRVSYSFETLDLYDDFIRYLDLYFNKGNKNVGG